MKTEEAEKFAEYIIKEHHNIVDTINDYTDKRIPISKEMDDLRNDLSRLWLALSGNPNTETGHWLHGRPKIFDLMQEYSDQQAQERHKKALAIFTDQNFFDGLNVEKHFPTTVKALKIAAFGIDNDKTE